jgi:hypothetical protein
MSGLAWHWLPSWRDRMRRITPPVSGVEMRPFSTVGSISSRSPRGDFPPVVHDGASRTAPQRWDVCRSTVAPSLVGLRAPSICRTGGPMAGQTAVLPIQVRVRRYRRTHVLSRVQVTTGNQVAQVSQTYSQRSLRFESVPHSQQVCRTSLPCCHRPPSTGVG